MLDAVNRMVNPADFAATIRGGHRKGTPRIVVHANTGGGTISPLVGFVVPKKAVPHAVDRNRVKRRLRHIMRAEVATLPPDTRLVVRVLKGGDAASYAELNADIHSCLRRLGLLGSEGQRAQ